ncbi:MAG: putative HTH-type transcriptional regulator YdfH [Pseudomonadota bacterium]
METSSTHAIVSALTKAIVEHRLMPGSKLAEQKLATHFGVSRTLVRQALFQLSQNRLIRMEPARGAFVAAPSASEAKQVFAVRRMLEVQMTREFVRDITPAKIRALKAHTKQEKEAVAQEDVHGRTELLGDFHVHIAELMGNHVLAQSLGQHSADEHEAIVDAMAKKDADLAARLMEEHLIFVENSLSFDKKIPTHDISLALS